LAKSEEVSKVEQASNRDVWTGRVALMAILGAAAALFPPFSFSRPESAVLCVAVAAIVVGLEVRLRRAPLNQLLGGAAGMLVGGVLGVLFVALFSAHSLGSGSSAPFLQIVVPVCLGYLGLLTGVSKAESLNLNAIGVLNSEGTLSKSMKLLDTSVIIDGRIVDIAEAGFFDGVLIVPQFVLRELQLVADSSDSMKRNRGRRGLDVVRLLQKMPKVDIQLIDDDVPRIREVDLKLIELAKSYHCCVVTNDFNLNKVAQVHGVEVLNINELANALKPVVLPGETMRVFILKEGKEHNQGVAYLDDGTMVVVDNAKRSISKTIDVTVTSVLQTTAGKMIFGKFDERSGERAGQANHGSQERAPVLHQVAPQAAGAAVGKESHLI
jgi:uncharacterized protein YacL